MILETQIDIIGRSEVIPPTCISHKDCANTQKPFCNGGNSFWYDLVIKYKFKVYVQSVWNVNGKIQLSYEKNDNLRCDDGNWTNL